VPPIVELWPEPIRRGRTPLNQPQDKAALLSSRRKVLKTGAAFVGAAALSPLYVFASQGPAHPQPAPRAIAPQVKIFDVLKYGAAGDGKTRTAQPSSAPSTRPRPTQARRRFSSAEAISTSSAPSSSKAPSTSISPTTPELLISTQREDYRGGLPGSQNGDTMAAALGAVIMADHAQGLTISGTATSRAAPRSS